MIDLTRRVAVFPGWENLPPEPEWIGSLDWFWETNPDMSYREISDIRNGLMASGFARIGGGAEQAFTLKLLRDPPAAPSTVEAVERDHRLCKAARKLYDALCKAQPHIAARLDDWESGINDGTYDDRKGYLSMVKDAAEIETAIAAAEGRGP